MAPAEARQRRTPASTSAKKIIRQWQGVVARVLIGLLVGVGGAAGVAFYLNRANTPFAPRDAKPARKKPRIWYRCRRSQPDRAPARPATLEPGAPGSCARRIWLPTCLPILCWIRHRPPATSSAACAALQPSQAPAKTSPPDRARPMPNRMLRRRRQKTRQRPSRRYDFIQDSAG